MANEHSAWPLVTIIAVLLLGTVTLLALFTPRTQQQVAPLTSTVSPTITVSATGSAKAQPAQAVVYLSVNGTGSTTQNAVENLSATTSVLNATLYGYVNKNLSNIDTSSYNVEVLCNGSVYTVQPGAQPAIYPYRYGCSLNSTVVYEAVEQLTVTLPNADNASSLVGAVSGINNVYVNEVDAQLSQAQVATLRPLALSDAMANATAQAQATLGSGYNISIVNITVNSYNFYPYPIYAAGAVSSGAAKQPIIYPGTSALTESVSVIFAYHKT